MTIPLGRWTCWEWELHGATNELALSVDDRPIPGTKVAAAKNWLAPGHVAVDLFLYMGVGSFERTYSVWYDEVAVDDKRIGCMR